jgi:REP-associated tyrosine transposase
MRTDTGAGAARQAAWIAMPRALRIDEPGLTFHVWANGVRGLPLFRDVEDREVALQLLREEVEVSEWTCLEYVLMTTHFHVLVRLRKATLSSGFHRLNTRYAQYLNKKLRTRGHVFDGRFESKLVEGRFALLETGRYIARNPVRANICEAPERFPWCGYGATIGLFPSDDIVDARAALASFGGSKRAYRTYVEESDARVRWGLAWARPSTTTRRRGTRAARR